MEWGWGGWPRCGPGPCMGFGCHAWPSLWPLVTGEGLASGSVEGLEELITNGAPHKDEARQLNVFP